jgi:AraC-like DNA-binding protein
MLRKANRPHSKYVQLAIESIKKHIDGNPFQYKTAAALLEQVSAPNRNLVEKAFKDIYGAGIKGYQVRQRLEASKLFLNQGMSIKQIAHKCYYSGQSTYCRAFKKEFNLTPTEWQSLDVIVQQ